MENLECSNLLHSLVVEVSSKINAQIPEGKGKDFVFNILLYHCLFIYPDSYSFFCPQTISSTDYWITKQNGELTGAWCLEISSPQCYSLSHRTAKCSFLPGVVRCSAAQGW